MQTNANTPAEAVLLRRERTGWYLYDWANSAFYTTVVTLFLGPYLTSLARAAADAEGMVHPFGIAVYAPSFWGYMVALSVALQVIALPVAGAVADHSPNKKRLLAAFGYTGAGATIALFFVGGAAYLAGGALFLIANVSFGASIVVYNSFLPEIAAPEERDAVSSKGWGIGYLGGGLLLAFNLLLVMKAEALGLSEAMAMRLSIGSAGLWWAAFTIFPVLWLRNRRPERLAPAGRGVVGAGFSQLRHTLRDLGKYPQAVTFLIAYLVYNDGIQTVIALATQFGHEELKIPMSTLAVVILMVQFVAFFGALAFGRIAGRTGAKRAVVLSLVLWTATLVAMYGVVRTTAQFFVAAAVVAIVLGGSQALSRSLFSQMIPKGKEAEYFGLYEISDKGTSWMGPLLFAAALQWTGSYRQAILSLIVFFAAGLLILLRVDVRRGAAEANPGLMRRD